MPAALDASDGDWVEITRACSALRIGRATLHRMKANGLLEPGMHWLQTTPGKTSRILWNPNSIRKAMIHWSVASQRREDHPCTSDINATGAAGWSGSAGALNT